jgi:protein O-GlcNAc transferase
MVTLSSSPSLQLAIQYHQAHQLAEAEQIYHQVLAEQPDHPEALYRLGVLAQQRGQLQLAEQFLNNAVQVQPDSVKAWFSLGNLHLTQEEFPQAVIAYRQALALQPDSLPICNNLGYALQQQGLFDEAIKHYQKALDLKPDFIEAEANLGSALHSQGKLSSEQKFYYAQLNNKLAIARKKAGDWKSAAAYYRQVISLQPEQADAYLQLAMTLHEQGQLQEVQSVLLIVLELDLTLDFIEAQANLGNELHSQGKLPSEQKFYYAQLNNKLAIARKKAGDWKSAVNCYKQAISLQPKQTDAYLKLGMILHEQGQVEEAQSVFLQALELKTGWEKADLMGQIYQIQGQLDQAVSAFRQGLMLLNPHYAQAVSNSSNDQPAVFNLNEHIAPQIQFQETIVGKYSFPTIVPVPNSEEVRPFWSVVIPVLNRPEYFPQCLASVLAQWTGPEDMEIVVLDNGSNPPLFEIPHKFGKGMIRYYRFPETVPLQQNWNTAVSLTRGQWIHLLHHDDYVLPGFYTRLKASLEKCSDSVGAAFTGYENIDENLEVIFSQEHNLGDYRGVVKDWIQRIGVSCPLSPPSVVIRRLAYEKLGGYKLDLPYTCDWEFYKRVAVFYDWWYEPGILAHYRQHSNSITTAENKDGSSGIAHRRAIEMSESYLPVELCATITAQSRAYHFEWCMNRALTPLRFGNLAGALQLIQEALKIDDSSEAIRKLFGWLAIDEMTPIRQEIVSRCLVNFPNNCLK